MQRFNIPGRVEQNSSLPPTHLFDPEGLVGIDANGDADTPTRSITTTALAANHDVAIIGDELLFKDSGGDFTAEKTARKGVASGYAGLDSNSELAQLPAPLQGRTVKVPLTLAKLKTMFTTPELLISSPGANKAIIVDSIVFEMNRTSTAISGGGAVSVKYASGADVCATIASTVVTGAAGTDVVRRIPVDAVAASTAISANALVITNADAVFADGAGTETANVYIQYRVIPTTA